jgi:predicted amidophosphoribosyltransferase
MGFIVLSLVWFMTRPRSRLCPKCGSDVRRGTTICAKCGYEFGASFPERVAEPPISSATQPVSTSADTAQALRQLDDLHTKNLISDEEYQAKRKAVLDRL